MNFLYSESLFYSLFPLFIVYCLRNKNVQDRKIRVFICRHSRYILEDKIKGERKESLAVLILPRRPHVLLGGSRGVQYSQEISERILHHNSLR